jgi:hypothetical protein
MGYESRFSCNFLDLKTERNPKPEMYEDYYLSYDPEKWKAGSGGGSFKFFDGGGLEYSLTISEDSRYGIMMLYEKRDDKEGRSIGSWCSVANESELSVMIENADELQMPLGSYLEPVSAWGVVKAFILEPETMPDVIEWMDVDEIPWPDD